MSEQQNLPYRRRCKPEDESLFDARDDFARIYLGRDKGVYSVGLGRDETGSWLIVSCSEERLGTLPDEHQGVRVIARLGGPGILCI